MKEYYMKKIMYILLLGLTFNGLFAMENTAENAAIADLIAEISKNEPQKEFNANIQSDLSKLEDDIKRAEEYHAQEKEFQAKEEEKAKEAAALLELIAQQTTEQKQLEQTEAQDVKQDETTLKELEAFNTTEQKTEQEILQEPALQNNVQEALEKTEDIEIG